MPSVALLVLMTILGMRALTAPLPERADSTPTCPPEDVVRIEHLSLYPETGAALGGAWLRTVHNGG